jgi:hypothetical protein
MMAIRYFPALAVIVALGAALVAGGAQLLATNEPGVPRVHKLQTPLLLAGAGSPQHHYLLPAGTSLYYDQAFPEGFVRYKVYVNVEGTKLESKEITEKFWLDPLTAFPVGAEQLPKLLRDYPVSKEDLAAILKSGQISKADIRALLEEYSR